MKELRFDDLYPQEYYFEQTGKDSRIAIKKFIDARDTMGMAKMSLSYISGEDSDEWDKNFVKTIHLRHGIEDLNNSFDLLIQIPWMYYRIWECFNSGGSLRSGNFRNRIEVVRNTDDWVYIAEQVCDIKKVQAYLDSTGNSLFGKIEAFVNQFVDEKSSSKPYTVRSLCNTLKHRHALQFAELYEPYEFNVNIDNQKVNLRDKGLGVEFHQEFFDNSDPSKALGRINYKYDTDLSLNIEFYGGDVFRFEDVADSNQLLKISEVYNECCLYYDAIVDLFEEVYSEIYPEMQLLPMFLGSDGKPNIKHNPTSISMNEYFKDA